MYFAIVTVMINVFYHLSVAVIAAMYFYYVAILCLYVLYIFYIFFYVFKTFYYSVTFTLKL